MKDFLSNQRAFTLLELVAVLMILGLLAALAVPRYIDLEASATIRAIDAAVSELNGREALVWGQVKTTDTSYLRATGDNDVWGFMLNDSTRSYPYLGVEYQWVALPDLGIRRIKAKIDTGARTSALHAFRVRPYTDAGRALVEFSMHPNQKDDETVVICRADVLDQRIVTDSGGHKEERFVIRTLLRIGQHEWPMEATLTARDDMLFRMLIGRTALAGRVRVDPARSYAVGKKKMYRT